MQESPGDVNMELMMFVPTASDDGGLYYICRRGVNAVAYFGISEVHYLVGDVYFTLEFPGSNLVIPEGEMPTGSVTNYFYGSDSSLWRTGFADCAELRYSEIYPGIDLVYRIQNGYIKYEFALAPYADPTNILLNYADADTIQVHDERVSVSKDGHEIEDAGLWAFQMISGMNDVDCTFRNHDTHTVGFSIGNYDASHEMVIDPAIYLVYSTFLGGTSGDYGWGIAVESGCAYVTGYVVSSDFPTVTAYDPTLNGVDCFVTKFAADGQSLVYSTFLGGTSGDGGNDIAVESGCAYVTGYTYSSNFPTVTAYDPTYNGGLDCFVTKFAADGQSLVYCTFLGGTSDDFGYGIAVESGCAYVTGYVQSSNFPTVNAYDPTYNGGTDGFVAIISLDLDMDGLSDWDEMRYGTDPYCIDSDDDNFLDAYEVAFGSNPLDAFSYPSIPQAWYDAIYEDLDGNATLIQNLISWSDGNSSLLETVIQQLDANATLVQQVISWLDGNHTAIETLFTYVNGNASLILNTVSYLDGNATRLDAVAALVTQNTDLISQLNVSLLGNIDEIRAVIEMLGASVGDLDYDGLDDLDEIALGTDVDCIDTDCDNLNDAFEVKIGTDPLNDDSDGDSYLDGLEVIAGTNPLDAQDFPGSTVTPTPTTTPTPYNPLLVVVIVIGAAGAVVVVILVFYIKRIKST